MKLFENGQSTAIRKSNWETLERVINKLGIPVTKQLSFQVLLGEQKSISIILSILYSYLGGKKTSETPSNRQHPDLLLTSAMNLVSLIPGKKDRGNRKEEDKSQRQKKPSVLISKSSLGAPVIETVPISPEVPISQTAAPVELEKIDVSNRVTSL
jgi:hypothetical protein